MTAAGDSLPAPLNDSLPAPLSDSLIPLLASDAPALVEADGAQLSYRALRDAVGAAAERLRLAGAGPGRAVAVGLEGPRAFLTAALAVWECQAALLPLDLRGGAGLARPLLQRARPALSWTDEGLLPAPDPRALDPRTALVLFTSGSSGPPKGVLLSREGLRANVAAILEYLPLGRDSRTALLLPLTYILLRALGHLHANSNGYVREHRLVMEQTLGRYLMPEEVVHHIDGVKDNNHPSNLGLYESNAAHKRDDMVGNSWAKGDVGNPKRSVRVTRSPYQIMQCLKELDASLDRPIQRTDLQPPMPSYRAVARAFGSWQAGVLFALGDRAGLPKQ